MSLLVKSAKKHRGTGRTLVPHLVGVLVFQICVLSGVLASPLVQTWKPDLFPLSYRVSPVVQWRRSVYQRNRDPALGQRAPWIPLKDELGKSIGLRDVSGQYTVLIFAREERT